jgi:abhydrolase domain-containing protein 6
MKVCLAIILRRNLDDFKEKKGKNKAENKLLMVIRIFIPVPGPSVGGNPFFKQERGEDDRHSPLEILFHGELLKSMKKKLFPFLSLLVILGVAGYSFLPELLVRWAVYSERTAAGLQLKKVLLGHHEVVYLEGGHGPTILMVHGFAGNKDHWTRFAKRLSPAYHVIALDLPGFGESTYLKEASYGVADQAGRVNQFADAIGLKKFHIVGNSMGGHISGRYVALFPQRVLSLGLFDSGGVGSPVPSEMVKRLASGEPNPLVAGSIEAFDRLMRFVFTTPPDIPRLLKKPLVEEAQRHKESNQRIFKQIRSENSALEPDLGKIQAPTLILWGTRDRVIDVSAAEVFKKGIPRSTVILMENCGHLPMIERPDEAAAHYISFLKGISRP